MGNDGGSIPTRRELVKEAAKNPTTTQLKETLQEKQEYYWTTDPITTKPLASHIVSDSSGRLFNKETILEFLLPSDDLSKVEANKLLRGDIKSYKDVVEVKFEVDNDISAQHNGNSKIQKWKCPVTNRSLGPASKAVYLVPCGHAFVASAIKEVAGERCPQCEETYASNDVIPILPTEETDIARLILRSQTLKEQGLSHSLKKVGGSKKRKKAQETAEAKQSNLSASKFISGIKNSATASLTAKVMAEQEERNKKRKTAPNSNLNSLYVKTGNGSNGKNSDFMTRGFSIPARDK